MPDPKHPNIPNHPNLPKSGGRPGYEYLTCYMLGLVIQELTEEFTKRWIKSSRRRMQMDEAGRSTAQNIAEGYTQESLKGYIYLFGISRGSNEELTKDYLRYLRSENLSIWSKDHPKIREFRASRVRWLTLTFLNTPILPKFTVEATNMLLTFCNMEGYLLKRLVDSLMEKHKNEGGLTEKLYRERIKTRGY